MLPLRACLAGRSATYLTLAVLAALSAATLLLRLQANAFLVVPSYFDSAEHLRIIYALLEGVAPVEILRGSTTGYYHLGFHFAIAAASRLTGAQPIPLVLAAGPVILAVLPVTLFALANRLGAGNLPALLAALLGAWGWVMPAYVLNWGKYPLLAALAVLPLALAAGLDGAQRPRRWLLFALAAALAAAFHTRALVVLVIAAAAWALAARLERTPALARALPAITAAALAALVHAQPMLRPAVQTSFTQHWPVTALVLFLVPPALKTHPRAAQAALLTLSGLLGSLFIPAGFVSAGQTALDRPFVETALFLPLAMLGALGLDGLTRLARPRMRPLLSGACLAVVLLTAARAYDSRPACCVLVTAPDAVALDWIGARLPADTRILAAASGMYVQPQTPNPSLTGSDAGVWIPLLSGRAALLRPFDTDFGDPSTLDALCRDGIGFVFVGSSGQAFDRATIEARPGWYAAAFWMPPTYIYRVTGCK